MHAESHPLRGETIHLLVGVDLHDFEVEDWADRVRHPLPEGMDQDMVWGHITAQGGPPLAKLVPDSKLRP